MIVGRVIAQRWGLKWGCIKSFSFSNYLISVTYGLFSTPVIAQYLEKRRDMLQWYSDNTIPKDYV